MDKLKGAKYFTKFNAKGAYNNIQIRPGDKWKAAFKTNQGLYKPTVMFFGMCNSPATFQTVMDEIFKQEIEGTLTIVYMDDILCFANTIEDLARIERIVLQKLLPPESQSTTTLRKDPATQKKLNRKDLNQNETLNQ